MSTPSASPPLVAMRDIDTCYEQSHVLRGVSLDIHAGETVALMGRNGMGKTTLIRTLMGLVRPRAGSVHVDGSEVTRDPTFRIAGRGLAYVPEDRGIFERLTVAENLLIAERVPAGGRPDWTIERVLEVFPRLAERRDNLGDELSGGEQQILAIGRALLTNPRLLILDEATEGLAPLVRDEIWRIINHVRATGIATLIVDKNVHALTAIASRVIILVKGEVAFCGTPAQLTAKPDLMQRLLSV